jgi:small-conductance mechanosensitive channel
MKDFVLLNEFGITISILAFITLLLIFYFLHKWLFKHLKKKAFKTKSKIDDFIIENLKVPGLVLTYWISAKIFTRYFFHDFNFMQYLNKINNLIIIAIVAWICIQGIRIFAYYLKTKLDITTSDNLNARKSLTQINVFKNIANTIIIIIAISIGFLTFEGVRNIGLSLLTSAGVLGIIIGLAAQKSIGMILSGIQIAITQPIRLDDVVIVENEWGRIEEITLTYVVVKIWDERRLVLPVNYFLENPFQNWTRTSADILGTLFITVDYNFPIDALREELPKMLAKNPNWDKRVANIQLTNMDHRGKELRVLMSSADASKNWDLRVAMREEIVNFISANYPESFAKIRIKDESEKYRNMQLKDEN